MYFPTTTYQQPCESTQPCAARLHFPFARGRNHNYMAHQLRYQGKGAAFGQINPLLMSLLKSRLFSSETLYPLINIGKLRALKSQVPRQIFVF